MDARNRWRQKDVEKPYKTFSEIRELGARYEEKFQKQKSNIARLQMNHEKLITGLHDDGGAVEKIKQEVETLESTNFEIQGRTSRRLLDSMEPSRCTSTLETYHTTSQSYPKAEQTLPKFAGACSSLQSSANMDTQKQIVSQSETQNSKQDQQELGKSMEDIPFMEATIINSSEGSEAEVSV